MTGIFQEYRNAFGDLCLLMIWDIFPKWKYILDVNRSIQRFQSKLARLHIEDTGRICKYQFCQLPRLWSGVYRTLKSFSDQFWDASDMIQMSVSDDEYIYGRRIIRKWLSVFLICNLLTLDQSAINKYPRTT